MVLSNFSSCPRFSPGMIFWFKCCCEGKRISFKESRYKNEDDIIIGVDKHPFIILSNESKNNGESYLTALPITSSSSEYNKANNLPLDNEMVDSGAQFLITNKSSIKVEHPTRIFKGNIFTEKRAYIGSVYPKVMPSIIARVVKSIGG